MNQSFFKLRALFTLLGLAAPLNALSAHQDTCKVGVYLSSLYDFDYRTSSYATDFWLWTLTDTNHPHSLQHFEFPNAKSVLITDSSVEIKRGISWSSEQCRTVVRHQWNTINFPFDVQTLRLQIEETDETSDKLAFSVDSKNTKLSPWIKLDGWIISDLKLTPVIRSYESTFGDPDLQSGSNFPGVELTVQLKRHGIGLFFKLFSGVYIAFAIAMMVFFFKPISEVR